MKKHTYSNIKSLAIGNLLVIGSILTLVGCNKSSEMNSTINQDEDIEAASQSEMLQMINQGDAIEIEIASPAFAEAEQGEASTLLWEHLALLTTNETLRDSWDDILGITVTETGKNGIFYVNEAGENENNNTLRVAIHNREFAKLLEDENSMIELAQAAQSNYADLEVDEIKKSVYMGINGYFNLLPDATPNYCNPDTTLQRNEFMAMVYRAETPVSDLTANETFNTAVGQSDFNIYAQGVLEDSYLDIESKSLDNMTYNGSISRAEAIYLLMSRYFAEELASVDISKASFSDAKDGGNIAEEQKFIEDATSKEHWKAYELAYALMNPDNGMPTELYKGLVVAQSKGLISNESRWDESITEAEGVELLVNTLKIETGIQSFNAKQGKVDEYEVEIETPAEETNSDNTGLDGPGTAIEEDDYVEEVGATQEPTEETDGIKPYSEMTEAEKDARYKEFTEKMLADPSGETGWLDDFSYDEVIDYLTRDVMSEVDLPSGSSSGHIDAAPPEGGQLDDGTLANPIDFGQGDYSGLETW